MRLYGLIGYPLGHAFSARYFAEKFAREGILDAEYRLFPLPDLAELPALLRRHPTLRGFNVTIPHKQAIIPYLDRLDATAEAVGAVNVVRATLEEGWVGYNTDVLGFEQAALGPDATPCASAADCWSRWAALPGAQAWILGTGGAASAARYVLETYGISCAMVSRRPGVGLTTYAELAIALDPDHPALLVNATPLGMYPKVDEAPPLPWTRLSARHAVYDMIYNPPETLLMLKARAAGCRVKNGMDMLIAQAEAAWRIFNA